MPWSAPPPGLNVAGGYGVGPQAQPQTMGGAGQPPQGPPGAGGAGGGGGYLAGRWAGVLAPTHRRVASETYWHMRSSAAGIREWLALHYTGSRRGQEWRDLWCTAESVDLTLDAAFRSHSDVGVQHMLDHDDRLEHWMSRIGAQVAWLKTGDATFLDLMQTSRPPGEGHVLPDWAVTAARDQGKSLFQQEGRVRAAGGNRQANQNTSALSSDGDSGFRRRRPPRSTSKTGGPKTPAAGRGAGGGAAAGAKA